LLDELRTALVRSTYNVNEKECRRERRFELMRLSDENLRGRTVIAADGQAIGEVAALFLDSDAWRVESLQIKLRKEIADQLGATRGMFHAGTLELPVGMVQSVGDAIVLSVPALELRQVLPGGGGSVPSH
jgi:sporulation protein YlmC with PRC-barrel domain